MQYSLRTLLIIVAIGPPVLVGVLYILVRILFAGVIAVPAG
jgi:hypothetical protein